MTKASLSTSTLAPYDTLILFEVCDIATSLTTSQHAAINAYLAAGNKILLYDADRCAVGFGGAGNADYSWFTFPFATSNPGPQGKSGTLTIVENSTLTQGLASDPFKSDELGDANTATTSNPNWFAAAKTTNALGNTGYFLAYARNKGLIIYDGADHWNTFSPTKSLTDLFLNELNQQYDPDNLPSSTPIAPKHQTLFVFLQGIDTELTTDQVSDSKNGDFGVFNQTLATISSTGAFANSGALFYSYAKSDSFGNPAPYACVSTFTQPIKTDAILLGRQIVAALTNNPTFKGKPTDVYLIAHSLGGVVAYSYLTALYKTTGVVPSLPGGDILKGVITFDSPIGGASDSSAYFDLAANVFLTLPRKIIPFNGPCAVSRNRLTSVKDLQAIFTTTSKPTFPPTDDGNPGSQGAHASILKAIFGGPAETNQGVAADAFAHGTSILTIGNTNDFLWNPKACGIDGDFISTQWIGDEGPTDAAKEHNSSLDIYGRDFTAGPSVCAVSATLFGANHAKVFDDTTVQKGLKQFLPNGGEPTALTIAPPEP